MKAELCSPKRLIGLLAILLLALPGAAVAATQPIAEIENLGDTLLFHPNVSFAQLVLTVTGPCDFQYRQVVSEGEPFFKLDATTIDGVYTYYLNREESIDPGIIKILLEARMENDPEIPKALCRQGKLPGPPDAQSHGFLVVQGRIILDFETIEKEGRLRSPQPGFQSGLDNLSAPSIQSLAAPDFVINDDLIVDGSACIGFDCVNGESFGFDTIRVKENNLRIKFDDTSVAASFPRNDWQLTANDSANGGASKFSIDDISAGRTPFTVEANARSHSLYVDDGGRIGSRTSTPSVEIHTIDGDTPTLRLQQDGSSGFAPQTWDLAGNETNFFVRDVTNGSTLPFRIRPGAPTSSIFIDVDSDVGVGTSSPGASVHVRRTDGSAQLLVTEASGTSANRTVMKLENNGPTTFAFEDTGAAVTWNFVGRSNAFRVSLEGSGVNELDLDTSGNLTIEGDITSNGTTFVPDYVFEPDYPLMPLDELATFVAEEKHLPNVPSQTDVDKKGGINVTQLQLQLLEKVEELTLYTLSQHETIQSQQETIQQLNERLAALEEARAQ